MYNNKLVATNEYTKLVAQRDCFVWSETEFQDPGTQ